MRFCGKQFDASGHDVLIDVVDNTQKIKYIDIAPNRKASDLLTKGEERQLRSVVGSLSWTARQARPDILYRVSKLQGSIKGATVAALHDANKVLELAVRCVRDCIRMYNHQEGMQSNPTGRDICVANAQEAGDRIRAALAELRGYPVHGADWETAAGSTVMHVILSDCKSLVARLNAEQPAGVQDKRLQIELSALRQSVFIDDGRRTVEVCHKGGDRVDWIDTATQAADCLTKSMNLIS